MIVIKLNYRVISIIILTLIAIITLSTFIISYSQANTSITKEGIKLPIIMYHEVRKSGWGKDIIGQKEFENDLKYLKENNYTTITMTDLINYVYDDVELPEKPVILTFDDGYLNNYQYVYPLLEKYNAKIVMSIIGKSANEFSIDTATKSRYSYATWDQIKEMSDSGYVEIQNHTYYLHSNKKSRVGVVKKYGESLQDYEKALTEDIVSLQTKLSEITGKTPNTFTYPYGESSKETDDILFKLGFKATLLCGGRVNYITKEPSSLLGLKRLCRSHGKSVSKLLK